jgi:hypothetical protein
MQLQVVSSGTVEAIGYDMHLEKVHVLFKDSTYYIYDTVPYAVYKGLLNSTSKGAYVHKMAKLYKGVKQ